MKQISYAFWSVVSISLGCLASPFADADSIEADRSLTPNNSTVVREGNEFKITGGVKAKNNLFHSFKQFSVPNGTRAYFDNADSIQNIIARVTGRSLSRIDGTIKANGNANLFLLNPNGIILGPNARLEIGGSFLASTAESLVFNRGSFSATAPQTSPLLIINAPIGLQYGASPEGIVNSARDLQVQPGKALALVGGKVHLRGGQVTAPGGRVELAGLAESGTVGLNVQGNNLSLSFPKQSVLADVLLTDRSTVDVVASGGGEIAITARHVDLFNKSQLLAGIGKELGNNDSQAGDIALRATGVVTLRDSKIFNNVEQRAQGDAGNIDVQARSLRVREGGQLQTVTKGQGDAGGVIITAVDTVEIAQELEEEGTVFPSAIFTSVEPEGVGEGGDINITARTLRLTDGSQLVAETRGKGNAGDISAVASDSVVLSNSTPVNGTQITSDVREGAEGDGGEIEIRTRSLSITDGAQVGSVVFGPADGEPGGRGEGGNIKIDATDVNISGVGEEKFSSGLFTEAEAGAQGRAGDVRVDTTRLRLADEARISASSSAFEAAGDVIVTARSILLENEGEVTAETISEGGNIILQNVESLVLERNSTLSAAAREEGDGGNITIDSDTIVALDRSSIMASAELGQGGNIQIDVQGVFRTPDSAITASSELGIDGEVAINRVENAPSQNLVELPGEVINVEAIVAQGCGVDNNFANSKFVMAGRGGLPPNPSEMLTNDTILVDLGNFSSSQAAQSQPAPAATAKPTNSTEIVEAQGWIVKADGKVVLTAQALSNHYFSSGLKQPNCRDSKLSTSSTSTMATGVDRSDRE